MRRGNAPLVTLAALALLAAPSAAQARVIKAETILPPGNSGFVSTTGLPSGTGSPHLTDQASLFERFTYKPAGFNEPGTTENPKAGVTIVHDAFGVPAITGTTDADAWWGAGYAAGEDRLFQLELFKRAGAGRLAEILGSGYLDDDLISRRDYYVDSELDAMFNRLPPRLQARFVAYRDGINAWIAHTQTTPSDLPGEFPALGVVPQPWTIRDSLRVGVLLARTIPSDNGKELANSLALQRIGARNFKTLVPLRAPGSVFTVPKSTKFVSVPGRTRLDERKAYARSRRYLKQIRFGQVTDTALLAGRSAGVRSSADPGDGLRSIVPSPGGSYMWAVRDTDRRRAYLFNGPQLGFTLPQMLWELEVHSPDLDARGTTAVGVPLVGIGRNAHVAWGFTSGTSDDDDLYAEKLTGDETYMYKGTQRRMNCRDEQFTFREAPTGLPDLVDNPGAPAGATTERICRTIHGPVQANGDGFAFARRYNVWQREIQTIVGLTALTEARTIPDVNKALAKVTWNENVIAADDRGHIGYWHPGLLPNRPERWDERLPYPGDGRAEWRGFLPVSKRPHAIDPARGWLANWNNVPARGWTEGDGEDKGRLTGTYHRAHILMKRVAKLAKNPSYARHLAVVRRTGTTAQALPFLNHAKLARAKRLANARGDAVIKRLQRWDGNYDAVRADGTVDAGVAVFEEFKAQIESQLLGPMGPGAYLLTREPSRSHQFDISNGQATALRVLGARRYARAAERAWDVLSDRFGSGHLARWREPRRLYEIAAQGAGTPPEFKFFDRGSWEQSVLLGP